MRAFALALSVFVCPFATADVYHVLHRRPSALLANISGANEPGDRVFVLDDSLKTHDGYLTQRGLKLRADDNTSTITIEGPKDAIDDAKAIIGVFDVAPRQIRARIRVQSVADKYDSTTNTQLSNNMSWSLEDGTTGLKFSIVPRINSDGTVTVWLRIESKTNKMNVITRAKFGQPVTIGLGEDDLFTTSGAGPEPRFVLLPGTKASADLSKFVPAIRFSISFEPSKQ